MSQATVIEPLLTAKEVRKLLGGVSLRWLFDHSAPRGELPVIRLPGGRGRRMYDPRDLREFVERNRRTRDQEGGH